MSDNPYHPFNLASSESYAIWRERKLSQPTMPELITIKQPLDISSDEHQSLLRSCASHNFAHFCYKSPPKSPQTALNHLANSLDLTEIDANLCADEDGLTKITVTQTATSNVYIPYTNRPLGWHTDGYYNPIARQIHAWLLYCDQPAIQGGINGLLDHEIAYIRLRDENPEWIRALMKPNAFTIPPNIEGGKEIRGAESGPVFSVLNGGTQLHMRYSARQRNIIWKDDKATLDAAAFLLDLFSSNDDHILHHGLTKGEGIISNNILHNRSAFTDAEDPALKRMIYRARYYNRII